MGQAVTKRPRGRPSTFCDTIGNELLERQAKGEPLARICADSHLPAFQTVFEWEERFPQFRELSARARAIGTHYLAGDCIRIADDPSLDPAHKRVMVDTRLRLIGKWNRKDYGERMALTGADGGAIQTETRQVVDIETLSYDDRLKLRDLLEARLAADAVDVTHGRDD